MIQNVPTFRTPAAAMGMRQSVSSADEPLSANMARPMAIILMAAMVVVFVVSQFLHWQISQERTTLEQLQTVRRDAGTENISLLAARARLMSTDNLEAVAGARLQLYRPEARQLHRL